MAKQPRTRRTVAVKKAAKRPVSAGKRSPTVKVSARATKPSRSARPAAVRKPDRAGSGRPPTEARSAIKGRKPVRSAIKPAPPVERAKAGRSRPALATPPTTPAGPSPRDQAVELFERGFTALQRREFKEAARLLSSTLELFPEEKELHERARVYLAVCERQAPGHAHAPRTLEERVNSATVAINRGAFDEALRLLRLAEREDGENDLVQYMLAVVHAGLGQVEAALPYLRVAVELNDDNRYLAAQDEDLGALRQHPDFAALLDSPPAPRRHPAARARAGR